jgi:cytochrome c oxidase cbb3-type subunit 3
MKSRIIALVLCCVGAAIASLMPREHLFAQGQTAPNGAALFAANCGACHGSDGRSGERAPNIATRREVVSLTDADLIRTVENGLAGNGMPPFGYLGRDKVEAIVRHLRELQGIGVAIAIPGDARQGEVLFFGKADCAGCHMVNGKGGYRAEELTGYGLGRTAEDVRAAILDPDRKLDRTTQQVTVVRTDGQKWMGFVRNQDNFSLVLQTEDGVFRLFGRDQIARVEYSGRSSMPRDYESRLSSKEVDDLVSYVLKTGPAERKTAKDDDE